VVRFAADENFDNVIIRGLLGRAPDLDILRVQDVGLSGAADPSVLAWATEEGRVLLTHDVNTIPDHAYERIRRGEPMAGVIVVGSRVSKGTAIDQILLIAWCSDQHEWEGQVAHLPLR